MNKLLILLPLILLLAACGTPTPVIIPTLPGGVQPPLEAPTVAPGGIAAPTVQPAVPNATAGPLWLNVTSPEDDAELDTPQVDVIGSAPAGAVVTVNDTILIVGADGQFKATIPLEEGPNLIEIIASNENGDQTSLELTVTYSP